MIKRRKRLIKNYYKKPNLFKIIITRAAVVFLIIAVIMLMITVRSYEIFLENERLFSDSPRTNFYENSLKNAFELYELRNDEEKLEKISELYGRQLTDEELSTQFELLIRNMYSWLVGCSANVYDENMKNGLMDFDKPFLILTRTQEYTPKDNSEESKKAKVYYRCCEADVVEELYRLKDFYQEPVYVDLKGYYLKDMDFIPEEIYLSVEKEDYDSSYKLQEIFSNGEEYFDSDYETEMRRIKLDMSLKSKDVLIAEGYSYSDETISGGLYSALSQIRVIYPYNEEEKELISRTKEAFEVFAVDNNMKADEEFDYSTESDLSFFTGQTYEALYGERVRMGEGDKKKVFNIISGHQINYWTSENVLDFSEFGVCTNMEMLMLETSIAAVIGIILTFILSLFAYQKKKSIYEMNIYQRDLTNIMAHDLKSPLMVIRGSAENIQDMTDNDYAKTIVDEADYMSSLITRILSFSKLESDQTKMKKEAIDIKSLVDEVIDSYSKETERRGITTAVDPMDKVLAIKADSFWIKEALSNLYDNAVKYCPDKSEINIKLGEKELSIKNKMSDPDVKNIKKLKKRFVRGDNARSGQKGNGLGLSIVDTILERNGLRLVLKKEEDNFVAIVKK
ncbi:Histidine kinase-, DNA gyrase B-, and HSP90-like ATPase [Lachnospiraceae bacterium]|nr:Histidine kinase-, DNA gyrase B-, and HSP90-like ATPase [Lachnospiraceae bacterium]